MQVGVELQELSDDCLIKAALGGDDEAFARIVEKYKRKVFRFAFRFARDKYELDDISQEVFIKVYENLGSFRNDAPFEHWLTRITVRTCYDMLRKRKKDGNAYVSTHSLPVEISDKTIEERRTAQQAHAFIAHGLARLRPKERLIITLLELEEKSVREIAALTGWSEANVKVRAYRARQALRTILEERYEE